MTLPPEIQQLLNRIPKPFRTKYTLVLLIFAVWMLFLDKHNLITQIQLQGTVNELEYDKTFYQEQIKEEEKRRQDLEENAEKYAREKYYMKKANEDVYIVVKE